MSLSGKVTVITGGATGIGFGVAKIFAERGAQVVIMQRDVKRGHAAIEHIKPMQVLSLELDICNPDAVERRMVEVVQRFGGIDVLVNSASLTGGVVLVPFIDSPVKLVNRIVDTNLKGTIYCSQAAARHMINRGVGGSIIHVSSVGAYASQENASLYCATKAAQRMLAQAMAIELAPHAIRVNCVAPGDINTETSANAVAEIKDSGASGRFLRVTPLGRRGHPEEVGRAIAFLASEDASFITGTTLLVDGGLLAY